MNGRDLLDAMEYISDDLVEEAAQSPQKPRFAISKWAAMTAGAAAICLSVLTFTKWQHTKETPNEFSSGAGSMSGSCTPNAQITDIPENASVDQGTSSTTTGATEGTKTIDDLSSNTTYDTTDPQQTIIEQQKRLDTTSSSKQSSIIEDFPPKHPDRENGTLESSFVAPMIGEYLYSSLLQSAISYYTQSAETTMEIVYHVHIALFDSAAQKITDIEVLSTEQERLLQLDYEVSLSEENELTGLLTQQELESFTPYSDYGYVIYLISEQD